MPNYPIHPPFPNFETTSDAVRGGNSKAEVSLGRLNYSVKLSGTVDSSILGAGFAGMFTLGVTTLPNTGKHSGLLIQLEEATGPEIFVFVLKEDAEDGRRGSTVSWEAKCKLRSGFHYLPWKAFEKTYRGKKVDDSKIDPTVIKKWGILVRSFFGEYNGDFSMNLLKMNLYGEGEPEAAKGGYCHIL